MKNMELTFVCTMDCDNFVVIDKESMPLTDKAEICIGETVPGEIIPSIRLSFPNGAQQENIRVPFTAIKELIQNLSYFDHIIDYFKLNDNYEKTIAKYREKDLLPYSEFISHLHNYPH